VKEQLMDLRVTIIRPERNETPEDTVIGFAQLAHLIAEQLKREKQEEKDVPMHSLLNLAEQPKEN
jgi:hypothetical protein